MPFFIGFLSGLFFSAILHYGFLGFIFGYALGNILTRLVIYKIKLSLFSLRNSSYQKQERYTRQEIDQLFFDTTFEVLGHITKAKGVVTKNDIELANTIMDDMSLGGKRRAEAQSAFTEGKHPDYPLRTKLRGFYRIYRIAPNLLIFFFEIQIKGALNDGTIHASERTILSIIADELHFSRKAFNQYLDMMEGHHRFSYGSSSQSQQENHYHAGTSSRHSLRDAYRILGVAETAEPAKIKHAYRKLMNEHHPDKLVAKGLPPEMLDLAKQRTQEIQAAYDMIKQHRGFK